jgi:hypothetical protein
MEQFVRVYDEELETQITCFNSGITFRTGDMLTFQKEVYRVKSISIIIENIYHNPAFEDKGLGGVYRQQARQCLYVEKVS